MHAVAFSVARKSLEAVIDQAFHHHDAVLITRRDGRNAILMSQKQYDGLMETMYLLGNPANAAHLMDSIEQLRRCDLAARSIGELGTRNDAPSS
ncbi:type II toxin-antitoxin system Phd/YefM family antitoxin [Cupriavidus sp. AU9028]|uniref:type II toxin-antitoxin system Phd/YefM family antitoxin n=1 Tax=Cupriavidus sp. AU9028 TaxID=2871157 RepID=UPI001C96766E|nr:type II toxin-antitoxin system Phd/YefM family antitoxin [Cupriavidus sp. AU9028]MBY4899188.1 type II toxin-antitoxin system Phd/YefM family antitoxin [Cupriavidus sp. AU9028]